MASEKHSVLLISVVDIVVDFRGEQFRKQRSASKTWVTFAEISRMEPTDCGSTHLGFIGGPNRRIECLTPRSKSQNRVSDPEIQIAESSA